ncbi:MAG: beta-ketoacyl-ACP synthase II [Chloroflexota bacterium]|nr:beta-ketoacyl-ACP synthase II [Chloroflexota bacterium]
MPSVKEIVVSGIGVLTSVGCNRDDFWRALISGKSGVRRIQAFDPVGHLSRIASEVTDFNPEEFISRKQVRRMARVSQFASCAAIQAVKDAGLDIENENPARIGCVIGSAAWDYASIEEQHLRFLQNGPGSVNPLAVPKSIANMPACNAAIVLGIHGPNLGISAACATGACAIGTAMGILREGRADVMIAGGAESTITPLVVDSYACMSVLSRHNDEPERASRPFDANRDGFVIAEGTGLLVLETMEHARKRGAEPLAVLKGFGMTADAYNIALPEPDGVWAAAAIEEALRNAELNPEDIGYINAHGTSTKVNDKIETTAIRRVFGDRNVPVSSIKSMIGHALSAAGAIEAAATVLAVRYGILPPTINYETKDQECDLDVVPNEARETSITASISNSFGFGGQNGVLVFAKL